MKVVYTGNRYLCLCSYFDKDIPKGAGFRWNPTEKVWWTDKPEIAAKLLWAADDDARVRLEGVAREHEEQLQASRATDIDIDLIAPPGLEYMGFQRAGISYALKRPSVLIADEMGLGKTIQAIGIINNDPSIKRVLVICPASLKINWSRELEKWLARKWFIFIADSKRGVALSEGCVTVINYDVLRNHGRALRSIEWDLLVVDEAHLIKNPRAIRSQEVNEIRARRRVYLTGTPIVNRPIELWPLVSKLDPRTFDNYWAYARRYAGAYKGRFGWDMTGARNLDELQDKLRSSIMVRRLKKDVLKDLPAKLRQVIDLSVNGASRVLAAEREVMAQLQTGLDKLKAEVELAKASDDPRVYAAAVAHLQSKVRAAFTELSLLRHQTALAKVPAVIEHVREAIDSSGKVVLFAHHIDVIERFQEAFAGECVVLTGQTPLPARQEAVDRFQRDPNVKLFIGGLYAAGVGLTLTAASHVIFAELDWVPGVMSQAEDRCHRIGQQDSVLVQHLVLDGSLDAKLARTLVEKQAIIEAALDKEAEKDLAPQPVMPGEEPAATAGMSRARVHQEAKELNPDVVAAVHEALRILAGLCDGAEMRDAQGFNRLDTAIGKSLAALPRLTNAQAALGRRLLMKYHRQLPADLMDTIRQEPVKVA